jgi:hypothetical protein
LSKVLRQPGTREAFMQAIPSSRLRRGGRTDVEEDSTVKNDGNAVPGRRTSP